MDKRKPTGKEQASRIGKRAVEERVRVTDHVDPLEREQEKEESSTPPRLRKMVNISNQRRLQLALSAALEIDALTEHMMELQDGKITEDDPGELVAMNAFLERMKLVTDALMDVTMPEDDERHDAVAIERILHFAPGPSPEVSHG